MGMAAELHMADYGKTLGQLPAGVFVLGVLIPELDAATATYTDGFPLEKRPP
jgi:hypothetical protein